MAWTNTVGGDHGGADWTPDGNTIAGVHYGIGTFTVSNGQTATISTGLELEVYADTISVVGTIQGNAKGYAGGAGGQNATYGQNGSGAGGGGYGGSSASWSYGGGGGGYGAAGGQGGAGYSDDPTASGGVEYGIITDAIIYMGSGGGGGAYHISSGAGAGGYGGGSVSLYAPTITVSGTITCNGAAGGASGSGSAGGAGAGGGILIIGNSITITAGTLNANGGVGGAANNGAGGGGAGGRIKIIYLTSNLSGITTSVTGGAAGSGSGGIAAQAGNAGTYQTEIINQCTSAIAQGQTFTIGTNSPSLIEKINLWVTTVSTSGDFVLKIWDSSSKNTEYGTKTVTISSTGLTTFTFVDWIRVPNGESQYYIELTTAGAGDIEIGVYGISSLSGGDFYRNVYIVPRFDLYHQIYSVDHAKGAIVYNTADTTVKSNVTNLMLIGAIHQINSDNTGTVQYTDDFTTNKYLGDYTALSGVTHDTTDNELDIVDEGYIYYLINTKYPVTGIPVLTAQINITSGTPTIQISTDASTWYDIDTALVDDVGTEYELDNATSLSLKGETSFYFRVDCGGAGTVTCSIKSFQFDANIITIDAENPEINTGAANTIRCDQDSDSGLNCEVCLCYRDRKWAA